MIGRMGQRHGRPTTTLRRWTAAALSLGAAAGIVMGAGTASAAPTPNKVVDDAILSGPSTWNIPSSYGARQNGFPSAVATGLRNPNLAPPGSNDWTCKPKPGQSPVVLVHGTWLNAYTSWSMLSPSLRRAGYCVFVLNYGITDITKGGGGLSAIPGFYGTGDIPTSAKQLKIFVDKVRAATGSPKVTLVGHSQGGTMSRQYLKFEDGASKVDRLITIAATNHGTTLSGLGLPPYLLGKIGVDTRGLAVFTGVSGAQQTIGSQFLKKLNAGGDTVPGVKYTAIATTYDEVSTPYYATFLRGPDVTNVTLQKGCAADHSDHFSINYSPRLVSVVLKTLGAKRSDGTPLELVCAPNAPLVG